MPVLFLKSTANGSGYVVRPSGYAYPAGLNVISGLCSIDYLVVAGGGGGNAGNSGVGFGAGGGGSSGTMYFAGGGGAGGVVVRQNGNIINPSSTALS